MSLSQLPPPDIPVSDYPQTEARSPIQRISFILKGSSLEEQSHHPVFLTQQITADKLSPKYTQMYALSSQQMQLNLSPLMTDRKSED